MTNCSEMPFNPFGFTLLSKHASANHLESHSCKTTIRSGMVVPLAQRDEGSEHREPKDRPESCKPFRLIQFRKNVSATPLESHTFKTKDLKPFRFTHFQKKGGGPFRIHQSPVTNHESLPVSPLDSALTSKRAPKSFTCNTYEKHTGGEGGSLIQRPTSNLRPPLFAESFCRPRTYIGNV